VDWPWIQNLDHLVIQRVEHQNEGQLVDFSFKLFLSNGRITHITSRQDFKAFRDISSFECIGVELAWTFIVKFPTSKTPEKQENRFVARSALLDEQDRKSDRNPYAFFVPLRITDEEMLVEIFYSNITWGEDLLQVISNHVSSSFGRSSRVAQKIASLVVRLASPFVMLLFIVSTYIQFSTEMSRSNTTIYQLLKPLETRFVDLTLLNNKLDVIIRARIDAYSTAILRPFHHTWSDNCSWLHCDD
jgi:hypothetical protein